MIIASLAIFPTSEGASVSRYVKEIIKTIKYKDGVLIVNGTKCKFLAESSRKVFKYIEPKTLKQIDLTNQHKTLILTKEIRDKVLRGEEGTSFDSQKHLILLHNIMAIQEYAKDMVRLAQDIRRLRQYVRRAEHLVGERDRLIVAIDLLRKAKSKGYPFIDSWYDYFWI